MILQVYDENSYTLIDNVVEAKVFEKPVVIPKKDVVNWINNRIIEEMKVFSFVNEPDPSTTKTDEDPYYYFREIFLEQPNSNQTIYVQRFLGCFLLNDKGKTVQKIK